MAFNFYGTYTTGQYEEFFKFSKIQESELLNRIMNLRGRINRTGIFTTKYDEATGYPVEFSCEPVTSYGAKLLRAYKILGGFPEKDMLLRIKSDPVYLKSNVGGLNPSDVNPPGLGIEYSDKRLVRGSIIFDRDLGFHVDRQKQWQLQSIKRKREMLEFKIKKALYTSQRLIDEYELLNRMRDPEDRFNLTNMVVRVLTIQNEPGRINTVENMDDIYGIKIGPTYDMVNPQTLGNQVNTSQRGRPT